MGGREIWVEDIYSARGARGSALSDSLGGASAYSEKAANERKKEEGKLVKAAAAAEDALEPPWWDAPSPGYCPPAAAEARLTVARTKLSTLGAKRIGGAEYNVADLADLREACAMADASVADRVRPDSARTGIFRAGIEFALDAAALRTTTSAIGLPAKFLTGLAGDVGVVPGKAGRAVTAAVAARVRSDLLQAGAARRQGDEGGAMMTLDGVIGVLDVFTPEPGSAEFQMIAEGLDPWLNEPERRQLLELFKSIGGGDRVGPVAEALGFPPQQ
mmetsp:Transcript_34936/g.85604  ORF Transcript_34936/g.85604 Transcript_34936/m.85604 type:complete len:274 (-) Transcript_34936:533-1354(-)